MKARLRQWLVPRLELTPSPRVRALDLNVFVYVLGASAVTVPVVHALISLVWPAMPLPGGLAFVLLLGAQATLASTARITLERSEQLVSLRRTLLGLPWFTSKRSPDASRVTVQFSFESSTLSVALDTSAEPVTVLDSNFHGIDDAHLKLAEAAFSVVAT